MRSGRMRSALRTSWRIVTSPRPSTLAGRASRRTTWGWRRRSSATSSIVTIRSSAGTNDDSALSVVVLPEPVPPLTRMLRRARTARASRSRSGGSHVPAATRSSALIPRARKRRTVRIGPSSASGAMTTFTREPSGSRASHSGSASSTRRPSGARIRSIASRRSAADAKRTSVRSRRPARSTHTGPAPLTITSSTAGSRSSGSSGPSPNDRSATRATSASRAPASSSAASRSTSARIRPSTSPGAVGRRLGQQPLAQRGGQRVEVGDGLHVTSSPGAASLSPGWTVTARRPRFG